VKMNEIVSARWLAEIQSDSWLNASPDLFALLNYRKEAP
jgi:hypothetical protein